MREDAPFSYAPVTIDHPDVPVTADNCKELSAGEVSTAVKQDEWIVLPLILKDAKAIEAVETGKRELSAGYHCELRRGYEALMAGKISRTEFGKRLAQEWASLPGLAPTLGGSRKVSRGQSFYAGDGLNMSLVKPEAVEALLDRVKAAKGATQSTTPKPSISKPLEPKSAPAVTIAVEPSSGWLSRIFAWLFS